MSNAREGGSMLQTERTDRRTFWWVMMIIAAVAGAVTWNVLGAMG